MTIDRLRYFAAVVQTRSIRKAAQLLSITPSSLSKAITVLEAEAGFRVIRPEGRGIAIIEAGLRFQHPPRVFDSKSA
jgi:DNA-binding transcriptional LysR family regulator